MIILKKVAEKYDYRCRGKHNDKFYISGIEIAFGICQQAMGTGKKLEGFCRGMHGGPIWAPYRHSLVYFVHQPVSEMIVRLIDAGARQF